MQNQKELEKEKALKKQEKLEKRKRKREKLESTHHLFLDPNYDKQKQIISQDLDEALSKAVNMQRKRKLISSADADTENSLQANQSDSNSNEETKSTVTTASAELSVKPSTSSAAADSALIAKLDVKKKVDSKEAGALDKQKKEKQLDSLKGWMGVDYLDVSSSDEDEQEEPPKSN